MNLWEQRKLMIDKVHSQNYENRLKRYYRQLPFILKEMKKGVLKPKDYYCIKTGYEADNYWFIFDFMLGLKVKLISQGFGSAEYRVYYTKRNVKKIEEALIKLESEEK